MSAKIGLVVLFDIIVYVIVTAFTFLLVFDKISSIRPYNRGFYCDDDSIKYPVVSESIGDTEIILIAYLVFPAAVILIEMVYAVKNGSLSDIRGTLWVYLKNLYRTVGSYLFGGSLTILVVESLKLLFGRLRPCFLAVCKPNMSAIDCTQGFVMDFQCTEPDEEVVADLRKSFPSGHAATAAYGMIFLAVYMQFRILIEWIRLLRPLFQTGAIILGAWICASRLQDYRHHAEDIVGGAIIGAIGSLFTFIFVCERMYYLDKNYELRTEEVNRRTMERGKFKGIDNEAFRHSNMEMNMTDLNMNTNGSSAQP